ncbi:HepT-like ribonuclease domain-containing protein [Oculatella sp. FACHB-28]|uniref:HepT-like ribonuclease domain-containing protein n=1 Tax=Oculatella sp. FACHB-28 TaxID=2692845 RepID=UPI0018EFF1B3|nr:HepT-like ribonuclease domain-containing protein [Oculatella sp. FACHB-28]
MSKIDDLTRLLHMRDAASEAINFAASQSREILNSNRMLTLALVKEIEIIGEAAGRISSECRAKYSQVPWVTNHWNAIIV